MLKTRTPSRDYVNAFAGAITAFTGAGDNTIAVTVGLMVNDFDADRAEIWLWDESSSSCYLTANAGTEAQHSCDYAAAGPGAIGKIVQNRRSIENAPLTTLGESEQELSSNSELVYFSGYPLLAQGEFMGVLAAYTRNKASLDLLTWWQLYSELSATRLHDLLSSQQKDKQINKLATLFDAIRLLNSTLDLAELLELILKIARNEINADRASIFLVDRKHEELWSIVASGLDHQEIRIPLGNGVAGRVASTGEIINVEDAYTLEYFDSTFDQKFNYQTRSLLCMPIRHHTGRIVGVLELLNAQQGRFTPEDCDFLSRLSSHMAMALENARLHRDSLEKHSHDRELILARSIQRGLLPDSPPVVPGFDIAVLSDPCFEVGGDYYDFINLGPQSLLLVIADVEGKGVSSALVMSNLQATLRALVMHLHSLEVLAFSLNEMLYSNTHASKYLSLFMGLVDTRRNIMHYVNAGHVPPILVRAGTGETQLLEEGGTVIGMFPQADYRRGSVRLLAGDILVCCTDGVLDISDENDQEYGLARLATCVQLRRDKSAQSIVDAILSEVASYPTASMSNDDKVVMVMKVTADGSLTAAPQREGATTKTQNPSPDDTAQ